MADSLNGSTFNKPVYQPSVQLEMNFAAPATARTPALELGMSSKQAHVTEGGPVLSLPLSRKRVPTVASCHLAREERATSAGSTKSTSSKDSNVQFCLCQPDPKIPRPRNAFILFRQHFQSAVVAQNPGLANPDISKIIGEKWRTLPNESKQEWKNLAEEEKARHQQQYPDYRYQPRRYGRKGSSAGNTSSGISNNPTGASVCSRCGGRVMNPPSTPTASFGPPLQTQDDSSVQPQASQKTDSSVNSRFVRKEARSASPIQSNSIFEWGSAFQPQYHDDNARLSPGTKRRRCEFFPPRRDLDPGNGYSSRSMSFSRPDLLQQRNPYVMEPQRPYGMRSYSEPDHDASLTLPPLQTLSASQRNRQNEVEAMVMTIPFVNKIKMLSKISPPFTTTRPARERHGAVIAVEGQASESVRCVVRYLQSVLSSKDGQIVRVFDGPNLDSSKSPSMAEDMRDATVQYLETISAWHKISEEIMHFINDSRAVGINQLEHGKLSAELSPKSLAPRPNMATQDLDGAVPISPDSAFRIALVPRYQLSTADAHACATPINDSYAPIDHWQWMASLWRGCVGPDVTVYVQDCEHEELIKFGEGNPVENRLDDARTLAVRRLAESANSIEEKALRRIGFEVDEFLRR
ncbi:HMG box transcriptional regulator [Coccidioides immitis RS]|uniref:HMG box transcriptional regulator n=1 Tax=Coccidioides immitis (strain RS) TaxID=246410 RepID=J3KJB0_COCIM|nr:HMG box transcriptional regulator [Coccidioides immitis RS]EAS36130.3 HMG box transcriptional regulator [Coccidioides immitis RS]